MYFATRETAGHELAKALASYANTDAVVLALPRGGVVLGTIVAETLHLPLGLIFVRKLGHPASSEYAIGAIAENGMPIYNELETAALDDEWLKDAEKQARQLIAHRRRFYFGMSYKPPDIEQRTALIVDDGIATGYTMMAAAVAARAKHPKEIIIAAPVASRESIEWLHTVVDSIVLLDNPDNFKGAIGAHYSDFPQLGDNDVKTLLKRSADYDIQPTTSHPPPT